MDRDSRHSGPVVYLFQRQRGILTRTLEVVCPRGFMDLLTRVVAQFESFRPTPYLDPVGKPTIGVGHLIRSDEHFAEALTREDALALLAKDLAETRRGVDALFREVFLSSHEMQAVTSFAFNVGVGALESSTLRRSLLARNTLGAAHEFIKWVWGTTPEGKKVVLPGLVKRRDVESVWLLGAHPRTIERMVGLDPEDHE